MRIYTYDTLKPESKQIRTATDMRDALMAEYPNSRSDKARVNVALLCQLSRVMTVLGEVEDKTVLDLGCGSILSHDATRVTYEPWLCRALYSMGAKPIGIDFSPLDGERFEHKTLDLLEPESLEFIPDNSIDLVHSSSLFDSPSLRLMYGFESGPDLMEILKPQLKRILKTDGVFLYN